MTAVCEKCNKEKPRSDFHGDGMAKSGIQRWCKACQHVLYPGDLVRLRKSYPKGEENVSRIKERSTTVPDGYFLDDPLGGTICWLRKDLAVVKRAK
jgi:hypothetical protein